MSTGDGQSIDTVPTTGGTATVNACFCPDPPNIWIVSVYVDGGVANSVVRTMSKGIGRYLPRRSNSRGSARQSWPCGSSPHSMPTVPGNAAGYIWQWTRLMPPGWITDDHVSHVKDGLAVGADAVGAVVLGVGSVSRDSAVTTVDDRPERAVGACVSIAIAPPRPSVTRSCGVDDGG